MIALVGSVFVAALLGSAHCAAMCGGLACFAAGTSDKRAVLAYNIARLAGYLGLGLIAGTVGASFDAAFALAGFGRAAAIIGGSMMVIWGALRLVPQLGAKRWRAPFTGSTGSLLADVMASVRTWTPVRRSVVLGLLTPLLPCGWLYAFVATAAATGRPATGALVMLVFWAGTVPAVAAIGMGAQRLFGPAQRRLPAITSAALVIIGLLTILGKFTPTPLLAAAHDVHRHTY